MISPQPNHEAPKADLRSHDLGISRRGTQNTLPMAKTEDGQKHHMEVAGYLSPLPRPIRSLSPDTFSNISVVDLEQNHLGRSTSYNRALPVARRWLPRLESFWSHNKGLVYVLISQAFGTAMNVTARKLEVEGNLGKGLHPFQIIFARMGFTTLFASAYMAWRRTPYFPLGNPEVRWLLLARGFGGFFGLFGMYFSLLYLPLADATVITFLAPGIACWACSFLINEPFTRVEKIGTFVSLVGVVFIARPTTLFQAILKGDVPPASGTADMAPAGNATVPIPNADASNYDDVTPTQRLLAVGIALVGVFGAVCALTTLRWIGKRAHPLISVNYFATCGALVSLTMQLVIPSVGFNLPANLKEWGLLFFLGICGFLMQCLFTAGLAQEKSSRATNMVYTQMLFALGADKVIFDHSPGMLSIVGSSLILGSAIVVAIQRSSAGTKDSVEGDRSPTLDDEAHRELLADTEDAESREHITSTMQEIELRALR